MGEVSAFTLAWIRPNPPCPEPAGADMDLQLVRVVWLTTQVDQAMQPSPCPCWYTNARSAVFRLSEAGRSLSSCLWFSWCWRCCIWDPSGMEESHDSAQGG